MGRSALISRRMARRNRSLFLLSIWIFLVCGILATVTPGMSLALLTLGVAVLLVGGNLAWHRYVGWGVEAATEERVETGLESLEDCDLFQDVVLPGRSTKIDHVVLAPSGIFAIETKTGVGRVECSGGSWTVRGDRGSRGSELRDSEKEIKENSALLQRILSDNLHIDIQVIPIICFAGLASTVKTKGATIVVTNPQELPFVITAKESDGPITMEEAGLLRFEIKKYSSLFSRSKKLW